MVAKVYIRASVPGWTTERQEAFLRERVQEIGDWIQGRVYRDMVSAATLKKNGAAALTERALLLRPTARRGAETVYVASMAVLGINLVDLTAALALAHSRNATVVAVADDLVVAPGATADIMAKAVEAFDLHRRRRQTEPGRAKGVEVAAAARRQQTAAAIELVRADWRRPTSEISTAEIAKKAGLSIKTLYTMLGRRSEAQKRAERSTRRKAARKTKR